MTREESIKVLQRMKYSYKCNKRKMIISNVDRDNEALDMAISALEQMPEVTSTMQTGQFDYVPIRETRGISCSECKYFKVTQQPLRGTGGLIDLGQARCEKHDLITDFAHKGKFKHLKPCEYFVDFKEEDEE